MFLFTLQADKLKKPRLVEGETLPLEHTHKKSSCILKEFTENKTLVLMDLCTLEFGSVWVTDKFTIQEMGGYGGVIFSAQFPLRGEHPIQFRYVPAPGYKSE